MGRRVPKHLDKSSQMGEALLIWFTVWNVTRNFGLIESLVTSTVIAILFAKFTAGQPPGHMFHTMYYVGLPAGGPLFVNSKITSFNR